MNMAYNGYTEARKRANIKYLAEKTDDIRVRVPKGTKDVWKAVADKNGLALQRFIIEAVEARIARESAAEAAALGQAIHTIVQAHSKPYSVFFRIRSDSPADGEGTFSAPSCKVVEASSEAEARVAFFDYLVSQMPGWEIVSRDAETLVMGDGEGNEEICEIISVEGSKS